jgi:hypothetical protein
MKWSISAHNAFRRCQRQYYFAHVLAHPNAQKNPIRKEAYILKQLQTPQKWQGSLVEKGIEYYVLPVIKNKQSIELHRILNQILDLGRRQFAFSKAKSYRDPKIKKSSSNGEFCALSEHEYEENRDSIQIEEIFSNATQCIKNLMIKEELLNMLYKSTNFEIQKPLQFKQDEIIVEAYIDLFLYKNDKPIIIDWKVTESEATDNSRQMLVYSLAVQKKFKVIPEIYEVNLLKGEVTDYNFTLADMEDAEDFIFKSSQDIRILSDIEDFDFANKPATCIYCNFKKLCLSFEDERFKHEQPPLF